MISNEGQIVGMHYTSPGKAIIAQLADADLKRVCAGGLSRSTPNSITDFKLPYLNPRPFQVEGGSYPCVTLTPYAGQTKFEIS